MSLKLAMSRARRGLREDLRLYIVAVSSLTVAFLCLAAALLTIDNLSAAAESWGQSRRMTVYLVDGVRDADVQQLTVMLEGLAEVDSVQHVSSVAARDEFMTQTDLSGDLSALPPDVFPASLEVQLAGEATVQRSTEIAARLGRVGAVEEVETYGGWFAQLDALLVTGRALSVALALLVIICVLAVVGNTIRLAVAARRQEVEVMKLCGATDSFVRGPFVMEGAMQGFLAALMSVLLLGGGFLLVRGQLDASVAALTGVQTVFLDPLMVLSLILGGGLIGALGSAVSLRRYMAV